MWGCFGSIVRLEVGVVNCSIFCQIYVLAAVVLVQTTWPCSNLFFEDSLYPSPEETLIQTLTHTCTHTRTCTHPYSERLRDHKKCDNILRKSIYFPSGSKSYINVLCLVTRELYILESVKMLICAWCVCCFLFWAVTFWARSLPLDGGSCTGKPCARISLYRLISPWPFHSWMRGWKVPEGFFDMVWGEPTLHDLHTLGPVPQPWLL